VKAGCGAGDQRGFRRQAGDHHIGLLDRGEDRLAGVAHSAQPIEAATGRQELEIDARAIGPALAGRIGQGNGAADHGQLLEDIEIALPCRIGKFPADGEDGTVGRATENMIDGKKGFHRGWLVPGWLQVMGGLGCARPG